MVFGYKIWFPSDDEKHAMRVQLDWYPLVAQWSVLVVFAAFQLGFLLSWLANKGLEYERPRSPSFNKRLEGQWTWLRKSTQAWNRLAWWTKKDVISGWGTRAEWIGGGLWTVWLLYLSIAPTGNSKLPSHTAPTLRKANHRQITSTSPKALALSVDPNCLYTTCLRCAHPTHHCSSSRASLTNN